MPKDGVSGLPRHEGAGFLRSNRPLQGGTIALWTVARDGAKAGETPAPQGKPTLLLDEADRAGQPGGGRPVRDRRRREVRVPGDRRGGPDVAAVVFGQRDRCWPTSGRSCGSRSRRRCRWPRPPPTLPVALSAEDDCGISRLQLFRSLNDSRPLPVDLPLPPQPPRRLDESVRLPLDRYGLEPGDVIKLFGRVEDNDPAGAKGAESSVVTVRIISQEEFERMIRTREGHRGHALEVLRGPAADGSAGQGGGGPAEEAEKACRPTTRPPTKRAGRSNGSGR